MGKAHEQGEAEAGSRGAQYNSEGDHDSVEKAKAEMKAAEKAAPWDSDQDGDDSPKWPTRACAPP